MTLVEEWILTGKGVQGISLMEAVEATLTLMSLFWRERTQFVPQVKGRFWPVAALVFT